MSNWFNMFDYSEENKQNKKKWALNCEKLQEQNPRW